MGQMTSKQVAFKHPVILRRKRATSSVRAPRLPRGYRDLCVLKETEWLELREALEQGKTTGNWVEVMVCEPEDILPQHHGKILPAGYKRLKKP